MSFTVHGEHPNGAGHSEFDRATALGAVFKATDLADGGWKGVHISDEENRIYWPNRFDQLYVMSQPSALRPPR